MVRSGVTPEVFSGAKTRGSIQSVESLAIWEGVAADVLESTGCDDPPVDAFELADCCGLEVRHGLTHRDGNVIYIDSRTRDVRQHGLVAHELAHWALCRAKEQNTEPAANFVSGALMLPRCAFEKDLRSSDWDLRQLRARHIYASAEMIARRIVGLRDAVATIVDAGRIKARAASPWLPDRFRRMSRFERDLVDEALRTGEVQRADDLIWAFPVFDGAHRRVVVIAEAAQLSLKLGDE